MFNKVEKYLFGSLLFAIPFQIRKIVFYEGWRFNEWLSFSIYLTDVIFFCLFLMWIYSLAQKRAVLVIDNYLLIASSLMAITAFSLFFARDVKVAAFSLLRLIEFLVFFIYIKEYAIKRFNFHTGLIVLISSAVLQSIIAIGQYVKQADLGLRYLGEGMLGLHINGVAVFINENGERVMRAYGTTPHPNVLAGFLFLSIFALYFIWFYRKGFSHNINLLYSVVYAIMLAGLLLTFSRTIIFFWALGFIIRGLLIGFLPKYRNKFWLNSEMRRKIISILLVTVIVLSLFVIMAWPEVLSRIKISPDDEAIKLRIYYASETIDQRLNWFGSGAGNFTVWLKSKQPNLPEYLYQPVHNIYLLLYSELGILGLIAFLSLIGYTFYDFYRSYKFQKLFHYSFILVFASILLMGMFDHFLWTLQQGRFVLWLSVALIATKDIKFE